VSGPRLSCLSVSCRTFKVYKKGDRSQSFACKEQNEHTMDDHAREQLRDEVAAYYAVSGHTNIAGLLDVYINADPTCDDNVWYLVMELCDGNAASSVLAALRVPWRASAVPWRAIARQHPALTIGRW
jgi:serine/threonine protein kinase